jgi:hypothetical protein
MLTLVLALLQSVSQPPDIELRATVRARSLTIEKQGEARVSVTASGRNLVDVQAPRANGRKTIPNPEVKVNIEARIADPLRLPEGSTPQN